MTSTFNALIIKLINKTRMKNRVLIAMMTREKQNLISKSLMTCSHCKKSDHEKPICFLKYSHKKKKFEANKTSKQKAKAKNKRGKFPKSSNDKFLVKSNDDVTTLAFMSLAGPHLVNA